MKKLICTILLGTALVGSSAWAGTSMDSAATSSEPQMRKGYAIAQSLLHKVGNTNRIDFLTLGSDLDYELGGLSPTELDLVTGLTIKLLVPGIDLKNISKLFMMVRDLPVTQREVMVNLVENLVQVTQETDSYWIEKLIGALTPKTAAERKGFFDSLNPILKDLIVVYPKAKRGPIIQTFLKHPEHRADIISDIRRDATALRSKTSTS